VSGTAAGRVCVLLLAALAWPAGAAGPEEMAGWTQWGGPARNGAAPATGFFGGGPIRLREVWRRPADDGVSALVVAGGRLFSLALAGDDEVVFALDAGTGKGLWRVTLGPGEPSLPFGVISTPATDGRRVFALSTACKLVALEAATGKLAWQHDLKAEYKAGPPGSCWTSPLLAAGLLVLQVKSPGYRVLAFDAASGAVAWSHEGSARSAHSSASLAEIAGVRQVVLQDIQADGHGGLFGLRLADGALLWALPFADPESYSFDIPLSLPGDRTGLVTWNDFRTLEVRRQGEKLAAVRLWESRDVRAEIQPVNLHAVADGGHVYGFGGEFLVCLDAATGRTVWKEKIYPGSLILVDGRLVVQSRGSGLVRVVAATPAGYRELARAEVFAPGALSRTPPSFAGGRLFLRNSDEIVAMEIEAGGR
jgi:outer membrane protein assembly factor BamB